MRSSHTIRAEDRAPPDAPPPAASGASAEDSGWEAAQAPRGRHAAITAHLTKWSDYETWARQARDAWQEEPGAAAPQGTAED